MKFLVLADSHINPSCPNVEEWEGLGKFVLDYKPDCIVHLGDLADLQSQARYTSQRGLYTLGEEMECVAEHVHAFEDVLLKDRIQSRAMKKKQYKPRKVFCLGNHDVRNNITDIEEFMTDCGWEVHDYLEPVTIEGITFAHCMMKELSEQPCTTAEELLQNWHSDVVVGHSHVQDYAESYNIGTDKRIHAIKCPSFNSYDTGWAVQTRNKWARGFLLLKTNPFEFMWKDITCLQKIY